MPTKVDLTRVDWEKKPVEDAKRDCGGLLKSVRGRSRRAFLWLRLGCGRDVASYVSRLAIQCDSIKRSLAWRGLVVLSGSLVSSFF